MTRRVMNGICRYVPARKSQSRCNHAAIGKVRGKHNIRLVLEPRREYQDKPMQRIQIVMGKMPAGANDEAGSYSMT
jgi:hypothetical protein